MFTEAIPYQTWRIYFRKNIFNKLLSPNVSVSVAGPAGIY